MSTDKPDLLSATKEIFDSMLGLNLQPLNGQSLPQEPDRVTASIGLSGGWNGAVVFECSRQTACMLAGAMLQIEFDECDSDVKDVIGEITNMVAGNVSRFLSGSPALSPPCIVEGSDYSMDVLGVRELAKESMACQDKSIIVKVLEAAS